MSLQVLHRFSSGSRRGVASLRSIRSSVAFFSEGYCTSMSCHASLRRQQFYFGTLFGEKLKGCSLTSLAFRCVGALRSGNNRNNKQPVEEAERSQFEGRNFRKASLSTLSKQSSNRKASVGSSSNQRRRSRIVSSVDTLPFLPGEKAWNSPSLARSLHSAYSDEEVDEFEDEVWGEEGSASQRVDFSTMIKAKVKPSTKKGETDIKFDESSRKKKVPSTRGTLFKSEEQDESSSKPIKKTSSLREAGISVSKTSRRKKESALDDSSDWENTDFNLDEYAPQRRAGRIKHKKEEAPLGVGGEEKKKKRTLESSDSEAFTETKKRSKTMVVEEDLWDDDLEASKRKKRLKKASTVIGASTDPEIKSRRSNKDSPCQEKEDEMDAVSDLSTQQDYPKREIKDSSGLEAVEDADSVPSHLTQTRFDKYQISPLSIKALHNVLKYERMTTVQEATFPVILKGQDVLAKARTGTGKTIAFLLPAIEAILKEPSGVRSHNPIYVLIVCPTRELAQQAAAEARVLLRYHINIGAQVVYGGNPIRKEQGDLKRNPCQILVGTPGRLVDHITRTPEIARQLKSVKMFVLDEADHMLDMGFRDSLQKIMRAIPSQRQTLLFSATIPQEVHSMGKVALKDNHVFIDTVGKDSQDTHAKVKQQYVVVPLDKQTTVLYSALKEHMEGEPQYKVLVFCTTARGTGFMCQLFKCLGFNAREIHSRKDQAYRTRISDEFRHSKGGIILFTSDVSARGVDYPNVTLVVQLGAPSDGEQYIHRIGRTGRAGKKGEGLLLLAPWEMYFLDMLKKTPITKLPAPKISSQVEKKILSAASNIDDKLRCQAYTAWLGYYKSLKGITLDKNRLVEYANQYSWSMGFEDPPPISRMLASKMNVLGVPGITIAR